jgi:hypothetical protein
MIKHPQAQISHCPQCADKENTNVVQRGMKDKPRHHEDVTVLVVLQKVLLLETVAP